MTKRLIVQIDEEKCDGCGLCVPSCAEGAIQIRDGKARLVSETYCDGLGACLAQCPRGAITIIEREAEPFDEENKPGTVPIFVPTKMGLSPSQAPEPAASSCPGIAVQSVQLNLIGPTAPSSPVWCETSPSIAEGEQPSALRQWPIQLRLVPPDAPFLADADVLLVADCVPFALADFHRRFLQGRPVLIGCPKLDDQSFYVDKLTEMLTRSPIRSLTVIHMEVPCCTGLVRIAAAALQASGKNIPLENVAVSIRGKVLSRQTP